MVKWWLCGKGSGMGCSVCLSMLWRCLLKVLHSQQTNMIIDRGQSGALSLVNIPTNTGEKVSE